MKVDLVGGVDIGSLIAKSVIMAPDGEGGKVLSYSILKKGIVEEMEG